MKYYLRSLASICCGLKFFLKIRNMRSSAVLIITILLIGRVENIRLCGRQLADLLNSICEKNGGFHTPSENTDGMYSTIFV